MNERHVIVVLSLVVLLTLSAVGAASLASAQGTPQTTTAQPQRTVLQIAENTPEISTFVSLLERANMTSPLNDPTASYTVLAPDNTAFANGSLALGNTTNTTQLRLALFNYIIQGAVNFTQNGSVTTLAGQQIQYSVNSSTVTLHTVGGPRVVANISANNGVIHVIDELLIPVTGAPAGLRVGPIGWPTTASTQTGSATASQSPGPVPGFDVLFGVGALTAVAACAYAMRFRRS